MVATICQQVKCPKCPINDSDVSILMPLEHWKTVTLTNNSFIHVEDLTPYFLSEKLYPRTIFEYTLLCISVNVNMFVYMYVCMYLHNKYF